MPVYPGGISRQEIEQRFRQLQQQMRQALQGDIKREVVTYLRAGSSGETTSTTATIATLTYSQSIAAATWTVDHNLGRKPAVTVIDSSGREVQAIVEHPSDVKVRVKFAEPQTGKVLMV